MKPLAEDRLRASMDAEADRVEPSPDSLDVIRTRVRGAHRRRRTLLAGTALAAVVVAAVALPRLGDPAAKVSTGNRPSTTEATEPDAPSERPGLVPLYIWPAAGGSTYGDPVAATDAFLAQVIGVNDAPLSEFQGGDGGGTVDVHGRGEDGRELDRVVATVLLIRDGGSWYVAQATSLDVVVDVPAPASAVGLATTVTGESRGYEGTVIVSLVTRLPRGRRWPRRRPSAGRARRSSRSGPT